MLDRFPDFFDFVLQSLLPRLILLLETPLELFNLQQYFLLEVA